MDRGIGIGGHARAGLLSRPDGDCSHNSPGSPGTSRSSGAGRTGECEVDPNSGSSLAVKGAFVVATDDLDHRATDPGTHYPSDHLHFGTAGTLELGRRLAEKMPATTAAAPAPAK